MSKRVLRLLCSAVLAAGLGACGTAPTRIAGLTETPPATPVSTATQTFAVTPTSTRQPEATILLTVAMAPPTPTSTPELTALPTVAAPRPTATALPTVATPMPAPEHRIAIQVVAGKAGFVDRETGDPFVLRGSNYIRLGRAGPGCQSPGTFYHSTFNSDRYDAARAAAALADMHALGLNSVRVFINHLCVVRTDGSLSPDYVHNLADYISQAQANDMVVLLTHDGVPGPGYGEHIPYYADIEWSNLPFMTREGIAVEGRFWQDLIRALIDAGAPLEQVLGYSLRNEMFYLDDERPLSLSSGVVTTGNGRRYDLADPQQRQQMMDDNLVNWIDGVRAAIRKVDPTALVGVGFFQPQGPNPSRIGDKRVIRTYPALWGSSADWIDLHAYPGVELTLAQYVENYELGDLAGKPVIMGEFGAFGSAYASASAAARALQVWQVESCRYGVDGWLVWTWDSDEQTELWTAQSEGGVIAEALAPANRPDPCLAGAFAGENVALGKAATASRALPSNPPAMAVDGLANNWWGAGDFAPQWIEIDLGTAVTITRIRLAISQDPAGETAHRVWGRGADGGETLLHEFRGVTRDMQVLEVTPDSPWWGIRTLKIETLSSPSWVSWREIKVISDSGRP